MLVVAWSWSVAVVEPDVRKVSKHDDVRQSKVRQLILGSIGEGCVRDPQALIDRAQQLSADLDVTGGFAAHGEWG